MDQKTIRSNNLKLLIKRFGSAVKVAELSDTNPAYLSQIVRENGTRNVGDELAEKLERGAGVPPRWLSAPHYPEWFKNRLIQQYPENVNERRNRERRSDERRKQERRKFNIGDEDELIRMFVGLPTELKKVIRNQLNSE